LAVLMCLGLGLPAQGAEQMHLLRIYYAPAFQGAVERSPADPTGMYASDPQLEEKGGVEFIAYRRVGLYGERLQSRRELTTSAGAVRETAVVLTMNAALYLFQVEPEGWNGYLSFGQGKLEEYRYFLNGVEQTPQRNLGMTRIAAGWEYNLGRLGMRLEGSVLETQPQQNPGLVHRMIHFVFFIPIN